MDNWSGILTRFLNRQEKKKEPFRLPNVTFAMPDVRHEMWKCNRCGSPVFDGELELHSSFHKTQDTLLEKLMMYTERYEQVEGEQ